MAGSSRDYDVLIIGAGPIGLACGIACVEAGLSYLIIDKGPLVNSLYNYPLNMTFFSTSDRLEIGKVPFISHSPKPTRRSTDGSRSWSTVRSVLCPSSGSISSNSACCIARRTGRSIVRCSRKILA